MNSEGEEDPGEEPGADGKPARKKRSNPDDLGWA
jgi:hypothetical protein